MEAGTVSTTPDSTPAPVSTAGSATTATSTSERPTSAHAAFEQVAASMATETAASPETAATGQARTLDPAGATSPSSAEAKPKGEPPAEKWDTILANARTKAHDEAIKTWREQYGWAESVDRAAIDEAARLGTLYQKDRGGYVKQLLAEAVNDPELAPIVRSEAARILGTRVPQADALPDFPIVDGEGKQVGSLAEVINRHLTAALAKEVGPLKQDLTTRQQQDKAVADQQAMDASVADLVGEVSDLPHFEEHVAEIALAFKDIPGDPRKAMLKAWKQVVGPRLEAKAQQKALDSFKTKADGQTVDGSGKAASTPARPRNPAELAAYMRSIG